MKITYIHQYFNTPSMSGGTRSYEMARRLVQMGHEVNIVTSWRTNDSRRSWFVTIESGIKVHWLPVVYSGHMKIAARMWAFVKFALFSAQRAASIESDIVFATSTPLTIALPGVYSACCQKVPMVFEVRDLWPEMPIAMGALVNPFQITAARALEAWAYRHSKAIVALSPGMKQGIVYSGYPPSRIAVIPNSCDNDMFQCGEDAGIAFRCERSWLQDHPLLVYAGSFGRVNGLEYLIALAVKLRDKCSNVRILLVGDGAQREGLILRASQAGVLNVNLFFEHILAKASVPALLSAATCSASIFIDLPEMRVNSANKFFDGLASGKPIFLNYGGWMNDLVIKHNCGISAWGHSVDYAASQLDCYLNDRAWLRRAGYSAKMLAQSYFDRDVLASQLESVLAAAVRGEPDLVESFAPGLY